MGILQNKTTRVIMIIMVVLVVIVIIFANRHYGSVNKSVDPRVIQARELYDRYNNYAQVYDDKTLFQLLDSIELIYASVAHYKNSYEIGVVYNNKAAILLTQALSIDSLSLATSIKSVNKKDSLLHLARKAIDTSLNLYTAWKSAFHDLSEDEIRQLIRHDFYKGLEEYSSEDKDDFLANRINDIHTAQKEIDRRISVSLTNLGIIHRHQEKYEEAARCYKEAVELWERNLTAENNLRILLGQPPKKETFLRRLFPPDKDEN